LGVRSEVFPDNIRHCFIFILLIDDLDIQTIALEKSGCLRDLWRKRPMLATPMLY